MYRRPVSLCGLLLQRSSREMAESFPPGYEYPNVLVEENQWKEGEQEWAAADEQNAPLWHHFDRKDIDAESFPPGYEYPALLGGHRSEDSTYKAVAPPVRYSDQFKSQRKKIMLLMNMSLFFVPLAGVTYVPSIPVIQDYFGATSLEMTLTLVGYCLFIGIMPLFYGPISDIAGKKTPLVAMLVGYGAANICAGSSLGIWQMVVFRAVIAVFNAGFTPACAGIIADVVPVEERATSMGVSMLLGMVGSILGAPLAGLINDSFLGWRWVFYFTSIAVFPVAAAVAILVPETHDFTRNMGKPNPLNSLKLVLSWPLVGMVVAFSFAFGAMYTINAEMSPLLAEYFGLSSAQIGALYMPFGIGMLLGTVVGGKVADLARKRWGQGGFLAIALAGTLATAICTTIYGFSAPYTIAGSVTLATLVAFSAMAMRGVVYAYATELHRSKASTAAAGLVCVSFVITVVELLMGGLAVSGDGGGIGPGWTFTIIAALVFIFIPLQGVVVWKAFRGSKHQARAQELSMNC